MSIETLTSAILERMSDMNKRRRGFFDPPCGKLIGQFCGGELVWVFDPSYISKSGRKTPGVGYFWSGCAGKMKCGMEFSALGKSQLLQLSDLFKATIACG